MKEFEISKMRRWRRLKRFGGLVVVVAKAHLRLAR